jgi:hypothetical protein
MSELDVISMSESFLLQAAQRVGQHRLTFMDKQVKLSNVPMQADKLLERQIFC